ncbi:MAG: chorismate mutase [Clostridia bacterium]|nr:chorismate mutase [Clostridia bacterium]
MDLDELRQQIDAADAQLIDAFQKRMEVAEKIGEYKMNIGKPVLDSSREREKMAKIYDMADDRTKPYITAVYSVLFEVSRGLQSKFVPSLGEDFKEIDEVIKEMANKPFPTRATVACQGVEGAYSQEACEKAFQLPTISFVNSFSDVFKAIDNGTCEYGVLPIENSNAGTVALVYDLMIKHHFNIVRTVRVKVDHCCMMLPGAKMSDIKEVISHEQAISQSREFIESLGPDVKVTTCKNTAVAAQMVAESGRTDLCCLSNSKCSDLYGLNIVKHSVQDQGNNYTRFMVISKKLEIYPGASRTSLMMVLNHEPGALYKVLAYLYTNGVNLTKIESRPLAGRDFEFMFYFDLDCSIYNEGFSRMIAKLQTMGKEFRYLGSYSEIV